MIAIHTKYISPSNTRGARIKAYTADSGSRKGFSVTISYPHEHSYETCHFQAVRALIKKFDLDWDLSEMRYGDSADGKGYSFCFARSIVKEAE
jgi:hypothetical protein